MSLDTLAGIMCGWLALCVFTLHIVSSPLRHNWMNIPGYVRFGFLVTGVLFTWRSANLFTLGLDPTSTRAGHVNEEGMFALLALTYLASALAYWVFNKYLPGRGWERLAWLQTLMKHNHQMVPVPLTAHEVSDVARAAGMSTVEAGEDATAVVREAPRQRVHVTA